MKINVQTIMEDFNDGVDAKLASRMRRVNPEQFHTLVRMHLSFELDLNTEDTDCVTEKAKLKKWNILSFTKKPKSTMNLQKGIESGTPLTQDGISQIKHLVDYLSQEQCIKQEGIFRRTGKLTRQQELKMALYQGLPLNLDDAQYNVHDVASVMKSFLAELPEPLLTDLHYPAHCQIAEKNEFSELCSTDTTISDSRLLRSLQLLLLLLPVVNRTLLKHILKLLNKTATFEHSNKMNCDTLATLFTPHLMCPRKLSPEALHVNSQNLSGLVAFMIKRGLELFEIPPKLAMDIRAYWVEQERKLMSPQKNDSVNESINDATSTAHTVFSFLDHKLTAEATLKENTQYALAQLYATIQSMPESTKKRRLMKQLHKDNGQGTPRHVKNCRPKSLGDSIKKRIFQKKVLSNKIKIGCNISRSSSEENIVSTVYQQNLSKSLHSSKNQCSKSDDELSMDGGYDTLETNNLLKIKPISNSTGSINTSLLGDYKVKKKVTLKSLINISEEDNSPDEREKTSPSPKGKSRSYKGVLSKVIFSRQMSEPTEVYSSSDQTEDNSKDPTAGYKYEKYSPQWNFIMKNADPSFSGTKIPIKLVRSPLQDVTFVSLDDTIEESPPKEQPPPVESPSARKKVLNVVTHTSTPSDFLRRSLVTNEYMFTPIAKDDKSMSPITQSATKMTKAMQETMMTPRSRKPVMMISGSNICDLASVKDNRAQCASSSTKRTFKKCTSIVEEWGGSVETYPGDEAILNKENYCHEYNCGSSLKEDFRNSAQKSSITSNFREYLLSRSVLTASPVDLSFSSRTDDYEQSESDLNVLNDDALSESLLYCLDGNNPESDTSGIGTGSTDNSEEKTPPRKRGTSLQRNDSKRSIKENEIFKETNKQKAKHKQLSESNLKSKKKDLCPETSF